MRSPDPTLPSITFVLSQAQPASPRNSKRWKKLGVRRSKSSPSFAPHPPRYPPRLDSDFLTVNFISFIYNPLSHPQSRTLELNIYIYIFHFFALIADSCASKKTVDYRFSSPPRAPSRSSFALVSTIKNQYDPILSADSSFLFCFFQPKDIFDADAAEIEIVMPSPTESESSTDSTAGCSSTSHSCTHDGLHAHAKRRIGPSEKRLCCGGGGHGSRPGSSRRRARAVTAFIHVSPARRSSDLGSILQDTRFARFSCLSRHFLRLLFFCGTMLIREGGTVLYFLFRTPFLPSAVGGPGCKLCGAQRNASRSTCAIENSSAQVRVCCLPCSSVLRLYGANRERAEERGGGLRSIMLATLSTMHHHRHHPFHHHQFRHHHHHHHHHHRDLCFV